MRSLQPLVETPRAFAMWVDAPGELNVLSLFLRASKIVRLATVLALARQSRVCERQYVARRSFALLALVCVADTALATRSLFADALRVGPALLSLVVFGGSGLALRGSFSDDVPSARHSSAPVAVVVGVDVAPVAQFVVVSSLRLVPGVGVAVAPVARLVAVSSPRPACSCVAVCALACACAFSPNLMAVSPLRTTASAMPRRPAFRSAVTCLAPPLH